MNRFRKLMAAVLVLFAAMQASAQSITGLVTDLAGNPLPFSTLQVAGTDKIFTANAAGNFSINLAAGNYRISCRHVGYKVQEKEIVVGREEVKLHFQLGQLQLTLDEVVVKKGEDPAYEIIRNTIKRKAAHQKEMIRFRAEVYTKGQLRLRDFPKKFMGVKVDFEDGDTGRKKMIFLSESLALYTVDGDKQKVEVLATRVSGQEDAYGLSAPQILPFYANNISIGKGLNPRGFISPLADNALHYYRFKYEGDFFENGIQVNRIRVIPKRKFEPLFSGIINIVEDQWRVHSLELLLLKDQGLKTLDTLKIDQLYAPMPDGVWVIQSQVLYPAVRLFQFDAHGSFVNLYSKFDLSLVFDKHFFNRTILKYQDSSNRKTNEFWNETRPVPLQEEERLDYIKKDSLERAHDTPAYRDSMDRVRNKPTLRNILLTGQRFSSTKRKSSLSLPPLIEALSYNTVEGPVVNMGLVYSRQLDSGTFSRKYFSVEPNLRFGFANGQLNPDIRWHYSPGSRDQKRFSISGGSRVFQFNNAGPVNTFINTVSTLVSGTNQLKIYEARYGRLGYSFGQQGGIYWNGNLEFQDRIPLENTSWFSFKKRQPIDFSPNKPAPADNIIRHQAFIASIGMRWQPGVRFIEFPDQKLPISSGSPVFYFSYTQAIPSILKSDVDYSKWRLDITNELGLRMLGDLNWQVSTGGFLRRRSVQSPDYIHFRGAATAFMESFSGRFQLAQNYEHSHTDHFYAALFADHHFNGFLTNKIPFFRKLKWDLVAGGNALVRSGGRYYFEAFAGFENIFRVVRVDFVHGYERGFTNSGIRIGMPVIFSNRR